MIYKIICSFDKINSIILSFVIFIISPILFVLICSVWLFWGADESLIYHYITKSTSKFDDYSIFGAWGDTFGAFNALLTALGFIGIVITIILQYISFKNDKKIQTNKI